MRQSLLSVAILAFAASAAAQATRWVSPTGNDANPGTQAQPLQTINFANSISAPGDTIRLLPGTFGDEQGIIILGNKNIAVVGSGVGQSVIRAHSTLTTNVPTGFPATPVATQQRPVILVQGGNNVDLRDFTVDGNFAMPANGRLVGIYYRDGADGIVSSVEVANCRAATLSSSSSPAAVVVRGDGGNPCNVTLRDCYLHSWGKAGAVAFFDAVLTVQDSRIRGADHTSVVAQNGVQFAYDAGGSVRRSIISDIYYDPSSTVATGVLAFDADGVVLVEDTAVTNCEQAIYVYGYNNTSIVGSIRRNRIVACDYGVYLDDIAGVSVIDNQLQVSDNLTPTDAFSKTAGNTWARNSYSSYTGVGTHPIAGGSGDIDPNPRRGVDLYSAPTSINLPAGHAGRQIVVADFNNDGRDDFATVDDNAGVSLTVGLNNGAGYTQTNYPISATGRAVDLVVGDIDVKNAIDIAVLVEQQTPSPQAYLHIFLNDHFGVGIGVMTMVTSQNFAAASVTDLAIGELSGDTAPDFVVAATAAVAPPGSLGGTVYNLTALPPNYGAIYSVSQIPAPAFFAGSVRGVAVVDLDGDNDNDVCAVEGDALSGRLHLFANTAGTFAAAAGSPLTTAVDPTAVAAADLDGDSVAELVASSGTFANSTPGATSIFERVGSNWRRSVYFTESAASRVVLGNVDGDSDPDSTFGDAVVLNVDGGTITAYSAFIDRAGFSGGGILAAGMQPTGAAFGDADGDEFADLFVTNGIGGQVLIYNGRPSARVDYYGYGTEGYRSKVPYIAPNGLPAVPVQPNLGLGVTLSDGQPFTLGVVIASFLPAATLAPNSVQVDLGTMFYALWAVTDIDGKFTVPFALPGSPSIQGFPVYFQGAVLDTVGNFNLFPGVALSKGMKLRLGY